MFKYSRNNYCYMTNVYDEISKLIHVDDGTIAGLSVSHGDLEKDFEMS